MTLKKQKIERKPPLADYVKSLSPVKIHNQDLDKVLSKYNKILPKIYLGTYEAAEDKNFLKEKNIKAVLNCTKDVDNKFAHDPNIEYMRIPVNDTLRENDFKMMYKFLPIVTEFIHKHVDIQGNNILIHCVAGKQRSVCATVAYLMKHRGHNPYEACKFVLEKRPEAFHHGLSLNFDQAIKWYYADLQKEKSKR